MNSSVQLYVVLTLTPFKFISDSPGIKTFYIYFFRSLHMVFKKCNKKTQQKYFMTRCTYMLVCKGYVLSNYLYLQLCYIETPFRKTISWTWKVAKFTLAMYWVIIIANVIILLAKVVISRIDSMSLQSC